jgi:hypothetical protein
MVLGRSFEQGTRVRSRRATAFAGCGTPGCVLGAWPTIPHTYEIRFDGHCLTWLMWEDELEYIDDEAVAVGLDVHAP